MPMTTVRRPPRVAFVIEVVLVVILVSWVVWETTIAFSRGVHHLPVFGWRIRGGAASGLELLFACTGLSIGIMAIASVLVNRGFRDDRTSR
jgi:hypothetical protein